MLACVKEFSLFKCNSANPTLLYYILLSICMLTILLILEKPIVVVDPCYPSPCGPNSNCHVIGETGVCSCFANYVGRPPNCRPECTLNSDCPRNLACINEKCKDPCPGSCGSYTTCTVNNHQPICTCYEQYTGDPFSSCSPISKETIRKIIRKPCTERNFENSKFFVSTLTFHNLIQIRLK